MEPNDFQDMHNAFLKYLEEHDCHGKTLFHHPAAVEIYMVKYVRNQINPTFTSFYDISIDEIKSTYRLLQESDAWEQEIKLKTWKTRLKAIDHFISFRQEYRNH